jgi:two-component system chemotaxis response regulator CheB
MPKCNIIVVGASAGGVSALTDFVKALPQDFPASVFIVLHTSPHSPSQLPQILTRAGALKATHAEDGEQIEQGRIYIAPPDHHLLLEKGNRMIVKRDLKKMVFGPVLMRCFVRLLIYMDRG